MITAPGVGDPNEVGPTYAWDFPTTSATPGGTGGGGGGAGGAGGGGAGGGAGGVSPDIARARQALGLPAGGGGGGWPPGAAQGGLGGGSFSGRDFANANVAASPRPGVALGMAGMVGGLAGGPIGLGIDAARLGAGALGYGGFNTPGPRLSPDVQAQLASDYGSALGPGSRVTGLGGVYGGPGSELGRDRANALGGGGGNYGGGNLGGGPGAMGAGRDPGGPPGGWAGGGEVFEGPSGTAEEKGVMRKSEHMLDRSGLIHSAVPGRTDRINASVPAGAYIVPADVVSGLGEGNTMAGAAVIDRMLHSGPHGTKPLPMGHYRRPFAGGGDVVDQDPSSRMFWQHHQGPQATAWTRDKPPLSQRYLDPAPFVRQNVEPLPEASPQPAPTRPWSFAGGGEVDGQTSLTMPPMPQIAGPGIIPGGIAPKLQDTSSSGTPQNPIPMKRGGGGERCSIVVAGGEYHIHPDDVIRCGGGDLTKGHDKLDAWVLRTRKATVDKTKKLPGPKK